MKESQRTRQVKLMTEILKDFVDLEDVNFKDTPYRFIKYLEEIFAPVSREADYTRSFTSEYNGLVLVGGIHYWGACPHHLLPVEYVIDVVYKAQRAVLGLSKVIRISQAVARVPQLQEDIAQGILDWMGRIDSVEGVFCRITGFHTCMAARGVRNAGKVITTALSGVIDSDPVIKREVLTMLSWYDTSEGHRR